MFICAISLLCELPAPCTCVTKLPVQFWPYEKILADWPLLLQCCLNVTLFLVEQGPIRQYFLNVCLFWVNMCLFWVSIRLFWFNIHLFWVNIRLFWVEICLVERGPIHQCCGHVSNQKRHTFTRHSYIFT